MSFDRAALSAFLEKESSAARAVITAHQGSTPRETGTAMLISAHRLEGTIGGGALELAVITEARRLLADKGARRCLSLPLGPGLGQCCGGHVSLLIERFTPHTLPEDTPLRAVPLTNGARPEPQDMRPHTHEGWFFEPMTRAQAPVWIWGAGHVGRALVSALQGLPLALTWIDDAADRFPADIPPGTAKLLAADMPAAAAHAPGDAHHIIATYSHQIDLALTHALLTRPAGSVGLIGSATKKTRFLNRLTELGLPPEALARLICPIGTTSLGKEPAAIALGTAYRLLKTIRAGAHPAASQQDALRE